MTERGEFEIEEVQDLEAVWPDLTFLFRELIDYHLPYSRLRTLRADWEWRWQQHISLGANRLILIARKEKVAVGYLSAAFNADYGLFEEAFGFIDDAYVTQTARGKGVGTALLDRAEAWCRSRGASEVRLQVVAANRLGLDFWTRRGFEIELHRLRKSLEAAK